MTFPSNKFRRRFTLRHFLGRRDRRNVCLVRSAYLPWFGLALPPCARQQNSKSATDQVLDMGPSKFPGPRERLILLLHRPPTTTEEILMNPLATTTDRDISARASQESPTSTVKSVSELAGRSFLAVLFLLSGLGKVGAYGATAAYMSSAGVPSVL